MEKRHFKRIAVNLKAERISGDTTHGVFIENVSEKGLYIITAPAKSAYDFHPGSPVDLKFQLSSGETLDLNCRVIWSHKIPPHGLTSSIGMEIIDPPLKYLEFVKNLHYA